MSTPRDINPEPARHTDTAMAAPAEKRASREEQIDHVNNTMMEDADEKKVVSDEERDYTGTAKKTDPEEIALVRKLDWRVMVSAKSKICAKEAWKPRLEC